MLQQTAMLLNKECIGVRSTASGLLQVTYLEVSDVQEDIYDYA